VRRNIVNVLPLWDTSDLQGHPLLRVPQEVNKPASHRWWGWPGAFCLLCGVDDENELALTDPDKCRSLGHTFDDDMDICIEDHNEPCIANEEETPPL
jgi:hypothetical protein